MNHKKITVRRGMLMLALFFVCFAEYKSNVFAISIPKPTPLVTVNDYAGVLSSETSDYLVSQTTKLAEEHGVQIVIATIETLDGHEIEVYAKAMFEEWNTASSKTHDVLLLLVMQDKKYWAIQGKTVEGILSNETLTLILNKDMKSFFDAKNYNQGVIETFQSIYRVLDGSDAIVIPENGETSGNPSPPTRQSFLSYLLRKAGMYFVSIGGYVMLAVIGLLVLRPRKFRRNRGPNLPAYMPRQREYRRRSQSKTTGKDNVSDNSIFGSRERERARYGEARGTRSGKKRSQGDRIGRH